MNNLNRVFRFVITNIVNSELENIVWSLDTGESNISSEYNSTLQSNEDLFVYAFYNYTSSGNYTVIASTMSDEFSDTESLEIEVI
ncbi:MAG: hypothetical protein GW914_00315 [Candidatus Aenigmarchaeota archaeon]|nr:hypothetical protein [Candidatus Aenigmarchaeota archaeon]